MELSLPDLRVGVAEGDDVTGIVAGGQLPVYEADAGFDMAGWSLVAANAYLGAEAMADALAQGADVVVAGRVADPALAIAPILHHFGWAWDDWNRLAVAACCGHLLECGSQLTGGVYWDPGYKDVPGLATLGYPIAEIGADGSLVVTKPAGTGGVVNARVVKEQLLYEVHDPAAYVTPDVVLDLSGCRVEEVGPDRVAIHGLRGHKRPDSLKVTASFEGAWLGEGEVTLIGPNALARAKATAEVLLERLRLRGLSVARARADITGLGAVHDSDGGALWRAASGGPDELRVRLAVEARSRDDADQAAREVLAMLCAGAAGTGGARWRVSPRILTRSHLLLRERAPSRAVVRTAREIAA